MSSTIQLYGHDACPMVPVVRVLLKRTGIDFEYFDIRENELARQAVVAINQGNESVPTLVFPDGHHLTEPSMILLRAELKQLGYEMAKLNAREIMRLMLLGDA